MTRVRHCQIILAVLMAAHVVIPVSETQAHKTQAPDSAMTFTSRSELVLIPAIVTKSNGEHVQHLQRADFRVLENGVEQRIGIFKEVIADRVPVSHSPRKTLEISNIRSQDNPYGSLKIILLDQLNTGFSDREYAQKQILNYLGMEEGSKDLTALLLLNRNGVQQLHDFTSDRKALAEVIERVGKQFDTYSTRMSGSISGFGSEGTDAGSAANLQALLNQSSQEAESAQQIDIAQITVGALREIAQAYGGISGRKSLLWLTGGFPFSFDRPETLAATDASGLSLLFDRLNDANISLYPIDVRGLAVVTPTAADSVRVNAAEASRFAATVASRSQSHRRAMDTMKVLADMTGGRAFYNSNDLARAAMNASADSSSYYLLGYYRHSTIPGWKQLTVKIHQSGLKVRARSGFFVTDQKQEKANAAKTELETALASPFDYTALPLQLQWIRQETIPKSEKKYIRFIVSVDPGALSVEEGNNNYISLEVAVVARTATGSESDRIGQHIDAHLNSRTLQQASRNGMDYQNVLQLSPGEFTVHLAVRDNLSGRIGSLSTPLIVR